MNLITYKLKTVKKVNTESNSQADELNAVCCENSESSFDESGRESPIELNQLEESGISHRIIQSICLVSWII